MGDGSAGPPLSSAGLPSCTRITEPMRTPLSLATGVDDARIGGAQSGRVSVESFSYDPVAGKQVPVVLTGGRMPAAPDEVVLAPPTARELHAAVGTRSGSPAARPRGRSP